MVWTPSIKPWHCFSSFTLEALDVLNFKWFAICFNAHPAKTVDHLALICHFGAHVPIPGHYSGDCHAIPVRILWINKDRSRHRPQSVTRKEKWISTQCILKRASQRHYFVIQTCCFARMPTFINRMLASTLCAQTPWNNPNLQLKPQMISRCASKSRNKCDKDITENKRHKVIPVRHVVSSFGLSPALN